MEFGYRDSRPSMETEKKRTEYRYCRGTTHGALFARGYHGDGTVVVWDYRQPKVCFLLVHLISLYRLLFVPGAEYPEEI